MTRSRAVAVLFLAALAALFISAPAAAHPHPELLETNLMPYPFWSEPQPDDIYHVPTGLKLTFEGMMDMMAGDRVIYIGETHNNTHSHRMEIEILRELEARHPGRIAIGMEMFREPQQESLDRWTGGELSEMEFLRASRWYGNWSSNFGYYREIMEFARDHGVDIVALNPPKELQQLVGMGQDIPPEMEARIPEIDSSDPYHRAMTQAIYGAHEGGEAMQEAFLRVQLFWEENMAERIVDYLGSPRGEGKIMAVLAGGAHVQYGFGVPKKVVRRLPAPYSVVLPATITRPEEEPGGQQLYMDVDVPEIPLLSADFIWAVPYELLSEDKVLMGLRLNFDEGRGAIEKVLDDSPAMKAGVRDGDVLVKLDSFEVHSMEDVVVVMRSKSVGDSIDIEVLRDGEGMTFQARFTEPAADHPG